MNRIQKTFKILTGLPRRYFIAGGIVIIVAVVGVHVLTHSGASDTSTDAGISHVQLATVAALSSESGALPLTGTVTSENQATILAQSSGEVVSLSHQIGDRVVAGSIIGQFENSSQRAAVVQAEGAYEAAQASLAKVSGTTAANSNITSSQAAVSASNAKTGLETALSSAYAALDDAIHTRADALFTNPRTSAPTLLPFTVPNSQLVVNLQNERAALEATLADANAVGNLDQGTDISKRASSMLADAQACVSFLNDLMAVLNQAVPNTSEPASAIAAGQTSITTARAEVVSALSSVTTAKNAYESAVSGAQSAANSATAGTESDIAAAQAGLKSAQGTLDAAKANLEKTIIRSPISGTIVSLPITRGDYVSMYTPVAQVSNPGALYIESYVTASDAKTISVGDAAMIDGSATGVVTFVAPAIDPTTGKVEVKIGIKSGEQGLTDGEVVTVSIQRKESVQANTGVATTLPLTALKMTPQGAVVFGVSTTSALVAYPVTLGPILGDRVTVATGTTPTMQIVTDARGLSAGQTVIVDPK